MKGGGEDLMDDAALMAAFEKFRRSLPFRSEGKQLMDDVVVRVELKNTLKIKDNDRTPSARRQRRPVTTKRCENRGFVF